MDQAIAVTNGEGLEVEGPQAAALSVALVYRYFPVAAQSFLDKADQFTRVLPGGPEAEEVPGHVQIGTRMLGRAEADAGDGPGRAPGGEPAGEPRGDEPARGDADRGEARGDKYSAARLPGAGGTLLAVVPIPGTGTSLAIVGYPVTAPENGPPSLSR